MPSQQQLSLKDKVVIITGSASGIGLHAVKDFLAEGARVAMVDRSEAQLMARAEELFRVSGRDHLLPLCCDDGDESALHNLVAQVIGRWGRIDVLINNPDCFEGGLVQEQNPARLRPTVDRNLYAPMLLTQLALPALLKQPAAHILNVCASVAELGAPGYAAYEAAQVGLMAYTRVLRRELAGRDIAVTSFCPGTAVPGLAASLFAADVKQAAGDPEPYLAAADLVAAVKRPEGGTVLTHRSFTVRLLTWLNRLFPALFERLWARRREAVAFKQAAGVDGSG